MATRRLRNKKRPAAARWLRRSITAMGYQVQVQLIFKAACGDCTHRYRSKCRHARNGCSPPHRNQRLYLWRNCRPGSPQINHPRFDRSIKTGIYLRITKVYANNPVYTIRSIEKEDNERIAFIIRSVLAEFKANRPGNRLLRSNHGMIFYTFSGTGISLFYCRNEW